MPRRVLFVNYFLTCRTTLLQAIIWYRARAREIQYPIKTRTPFLSFVTSGTIPLLTLSQTTKFWLFQTERVCRRQFQIWWKWQKILKIDWKHCGKRRNCSWLAISPFPTVFSKDLFCKHVKTGLVLNTWKCDGENMILYRTIIIAL